MSDLEAIDFHDARLLHLGIQPADGEVRLSFEEVSVFFRTPVADRFEVWAFTANVAVIHPATLLFEGQPPKDGWVIDDGLEVNAADRADWRDCLATPVKAVSLSFTFDNGAQVTFKDSLVRLTLLEKKRLLETWTGPLDPIVAEADLISAYFEHWRTKRSDLSWAWDEVTDTVLAGPEEGWALVLELIRAAPDDTALSYVAAGPLEEFICKHGERFLDRLALAAQADPRVTKALQGVWGKNRMKAEVWAEIQRLQRGAE